MHQNGHGHGWEPHGADEEELGQVEAVQSPVGLSKSVEYAEPEEEKGEEKGGLEDGVDGGRQQRDGENGPRKQGVVETEQCR